MSKGEFGNDFKSVIDLVARDKEGNAIFGLVDLLPWGSDDEHYLLLQERINTCMYFWDSGQFEAEHPESKGKTVTIRVFFGHWPDERGIRFLSTVKEAIEGYGIGFEYQLFEG